MFSSPASFLLIFYLICFSSLTIVLHFTLHLPLLLSLSLSPHGLCLTLSHCIAPVSRLPARQCGPGGSNQLNYWEHKNAAANGSWINTLAKLFPRLPLLPQGIKLKILRLRMWELEATAKALSGPEPQLWHARTIQKIFKSGEITWGFKLVAWVTFSIRCSGTYFRCNQNPHMHVYTGQR